MTTLVLYGYASTTKEFIGIVTADKDPEGGGYLVPAFCTTVNPPAFQIGEIAVFDGITWSVHPDYRGQIWYDSVSGLEKVIDFIGDPSLIKTPLVPVKPIFTQPMPTTVPDNPTLGDWRVGLALWVRSDNNGHPTTWLQYLTDTVQQLVESGNPLGQVIVQRLEYSNNVKRIELMQLKEYFQFNEDQVNESLWRAYLVSIGDLRGIWPLPSK